ncbi:hypothetical protein SAMN02745673_01778 [Marinactinospora thermotolerans DSM 45154]|uniref:Uncharacterized protein n=1 Tax=Marinactinospora thermotolerans DSM 45154 TaxID=1122192 RepID=A0A1T4PFH2_9ACTN|nr:hypothetical protein SAMN02745673_01778 [Marinactinospora thermotolerans DSM 45154]
MIRRVVPGPGSGRGAARMEGRPPTGARSRPNRCLRSSAGRIERVGTAGPGPGLRWRGRLGWPRSAAPARQGLASKTPTPRIRKEDRRAATPRHRGTVSSADDALDAPSSLTTSNLPARAGGAERSRTATAPSSPIRGSRDLAAGRHCEHSALGAPLSARPSVMAAHPCRAGARPGPIVAGRPPWGRTRSRSRHPGDSPGSPKRSWWRDCPPSSRAPGPSAPPLRRHLRRSVAAMISELSACRACAAVCPVTAR